MSRTAGMVVLLHNYARPWWQFRVASPGRKNDPTITLQLAMLRKEDEGQRERLRRGFDTDLTVLEDSLRKFCTKTELTASWRSSLARKLSIGNCVGVPTASSGPFGPAIFGCARL